MPGRDEARRMGALLDSEHKSGDPFAAAIRSTRLSMLITDPRQDDNPVVFANDAFLDLTGYPREEVIGRNCRFLQGADTDPATVRKIREAIAERRDVTAEVQNYRRDGSPFWNSLYISPVKDEQGACVFFFASQFNISRHKEREFRMMHDKNYFEQEISARTTELEEALRAKTILLHEVDHRIKNNLQLINSLLLLQIRRVADPEAKKVLRATLERIEALGTVHQRLYQSKDVGSFEIAAFVRDLVGNVIDAAGRDNVKVALELEAAHLPAAKAAPLGLLINEVLTNSLKHAFAEDEQGEIRVALSRSNGDLRIKIVDNGVGVTDDAMNGGGKGTFGRTLIETLAKQLHARIDYRNASPGTTVDITMPVETVSGNA